MVDMSENILQKSRAHVEKSLSRVAKKKYADDAAVSFIGLNNIYLIFNQSNSRRGNCYVAYLVKSYSSE